MKKFTLIFQQYGAAQQLDLNNCNAITFYNTGSATAFIELTPILPGASLTFNGNECEVCTDVVQLTFDLTAGLVQSLVVIKKVYLT